MSFEKVSISIPSHIYRLAARRAKLYGNNFSNYITILLSKDFSEEELRKELEEAGKPIRTNGYKKAELTTQCRYCKRGINVGDEICTAHFDDDTENWVHMDCCRDE